MPVELKTMEYGNEGAAFESPAGTEALVDWGKLVDSVRDGESDAMEKLYFLFERGVRFYLYRRLGPQDLEDKIHDVFLIVVQAIRRGDLREPERLMGFVRTIVRRQVAAHIDSVVHSRREETPLEPGTIVPDRNRTPEEKAIGEQRSDLMLRILKSLSSRDREILTRFYLHEESQETICLEMKLSDTQFRLLKSRAKARFGELGKRRLESGHQSSGTRNILVRSLDKFRH
ncbi:MAG: sigma-70 family RNA polymerase sigma factor [Bryobacteraceae bacterium]|nr:sigma-70 family RNA polymerase sigma factor [Bryobacteraceae bacterium]